MVDAGMRMRCVWMDVMGVDENKYKEKEREKRLTWSDASVWARWHADASWMQMTVKTKKKKRKEKLTGRRSWTRCHAPNWFSAMNMDKDS